MRAADGLQGGTQLCSERQVPDVLPYKMVWKSKRRWIQHRCITNVVHFSDGLQGMQMGLVCLIVVVVWGELNTRNESVDPVLSFPVSTAICGTDGSPRKWSWQVVRERWWGSGGSQLPCLPLGLFWMLFWKIFWWANNLGWSVRVLRNSPDAFNVRALPASVFKWWLSENILTA